MDEETFVMRWKKREKGRKNRRRNENLKGRPLVRKCRAVCGNVELFICITCVIHPFCGNVELFICITCEL